MTKAEADSPSGRVLIDVICRMASDGVISLDEIKLLDGWMSAPELEGLAAASYLHSIASQILRDGTVDVREARQLRDALLRVVPADVRGSLGFNVEHSSETKVDDEFEDEDEDEDAPSQAQLDYIHALGGKAFKGMTCWQASALINKLLKKTPPSPRQWLVLRFWDRLDLADEGKGAVTQWLNRFYLEDPDRRKAWELFKQTKGDDGSVSDPQFVPIGIGKVYLRRVKSVGRPLPEPPSSNPVSPEIAAPVQPCFPRESEGTPEVNARLDSTECETQALAVKSFEASFNETTASDALKSDKAKEPKALIPSEQGARKLDLLPIGGVFVALVLFALIYWALFRGSAP